ncbi:MAG: hypothetical protein JNM69_37025, partial [Archangium sp.]|nr:hypothetical protein [Archangium sp.]
MNPLTDEERDVFRRLLDALRGAEQEFVIGGGQAARLLRLHPFARTLDWAPVLTSDIDIATQAKGHWSSIALNETLERAGFSARFEGDDRPPLTHYVLGNSELEFIVPDVAQRHPTGATVNVLGVSAQKVKNLEPLLFEPMTLEVEGVGMLRLPNPAAYIVQKTLTLSDRRTLSKKGKDTLYVHDAFQLFTTNEGRLHAGVVELGVRVLASLTKKQLKRLKQNAERLGDARSDLV